MKFTLLSLFSVAVLSPISVKAQPSPWACFSEKKYVLPYAEIRSMQETVTKSTHFEIAGLAMLKIKAAKILKVHAPALKAHLKLKRAGILRFSGWISGLNSGSELAFYARELLVRLDAEAVRIAGLSNALAGASFKKLLATGERIRSALMHRDGGSRFKETAWISEEFWQSTPVVVRTELIAVAKDLSELLNVQGFHSFDDLTVEFAGNAGHNRFLPNMTWFGLGVTSNEEGRTGCPNPADSLLGAMMSLGLPGIYGTMLSGRDPDSISRLSHRVFQIRQKTTSFTCLRRSLPRPSLRYDQQTRIVEYDVFQKSASCLPNNLGLQIWRNMQDLDLVHSSDSELRSLADRLLLY